MNSSAIQSSSPTASQARSPLDLGVEAGRGTASVEWLPQMVMFVIVGDRRAELLGELGDRAVVVEARPSR